MASQGGTSRLAQMQMRFQQKQQQEREQRKQEMTGTRSSSTESADSKSLSVTLGPGKVRQMFDERRQRSTGIDKSYPLKPIETRSSSGTTVVSKSTTTIKKQSGTVKQVNGRASSSKSETKETVISSGLNGNGFTTVTKHTMEYDNLDNEVLPDIDDLDNGFPASLENLSNNLKTLGLQNNNKKEFSSVLDDTNNNKPTPSSIKLKPVITKKTVPPASTPKAVSSVRSVNSTRNKSPPTPPSARTPTSSITKTNTKSPMASVPKRASLQTQLAQIPKAPSVVTVAENAQVCKICGRTFNIDRIQKHQQICQKSSSKKRKVFDAAKHRVMGTEAEMFVRKPSRASQVVRTTAAPKDQTKKSNWRQKHEEFIAAIRAAKTMQTHLAKGGKLTDLPPPPPSKNEDYIQCPHCGRRFNQAAAERHIPKCANMLHNKPKPKAKKVK